MLFFNEGERYYFSSGDQKGKNMAQGSMGPYAGLRALKTEDQALLEAHIKADISSHISGRAGSCFDPF